MQVSALGMWARVIRRSSAAQRARPVIVVTHAPPRDLNDDDDRAHRGFTAFRWLVDRARAPTVAARAHRARATGHRRSLRAARRDALLQLHRRDTDRAATARRGWMSRSRCGAPPSAACWWRSRWWRSRHPPPSRHLQRGAARQRRRRDRGHGVGGDRRPDPAVTSSSAAPTAGPARAMLATAASRSRSSCRVRHLRRRVGCQRGLPGRSDCPVEIGADRLTDCDGRAWTFDGIPIDPARSAARAIRRAEVDLGLGRGRHDRPGDRGVARHW